MEIIEYFESGNKAHWKGEIAKGDWSAATYLGLAVSSAITRISEGPATESIPT